MKTKRQGALIFGAVLFAVAAAFAIVFFSSAAGQAGAAPTPTEEKENGEPEQPAAAQTGEAELLYASLGNGTCAVTGPGSLRESCLVIPGVSPAGERVVKIAARAFYGCRGIAVIRIPETVTEIGALAFADCRDLTYLSVSAQNPVYRDVEGVLFTADGRVLIQYPPMRYGEPFDLPKSVAAIAEMAFYGCQNLKSVAYAGSGEDWERIGIGARNYGLIAATVFFAKSGEE